MEPIKLPETKSERFFAGTEKAKKKMTMTLRNKLNFIVGIFIVFVVVIFSTTDMHLTSAFDWAALGMMFFILLFASYSMYINTSSAGSKAGRETEAYKKVKERHEQLRRQITEKKLQGALPHFCKKYVEEELKNTREAILAEVGINYEDYVAKWRSADKKTVRVTENLTEREKKAIIAANSTKPITLTSDMIFKGDRKKTSRDPLGIDAHTIKTQTYAAKLIQSFAISAVPVVIVLEVTTGFTWATFASILMKILPIVVNAFSGFEFGFKNIVVDTVNHLNDQSDLIEQCIVWAENK